MLDKNSSEEQLKSVRKETERLRAENAHLRAMLGIPDSAVERGSPPEVNAVETLNGRATVMAIAPQLAPELVGETSRVMIQAKIDKAHRKALSCLAKAANGHEHG